MGINLSILNEVEIYHTAMKPFVLTFAESEIFKGEFSCMISHCVDEWLKEKQHHWFFFFL